jgi:catechol 2,3-dioxygenase-like lactoylglutathione lyase family enzyme
MGAEVSPMTTTSGDHTAAAQTFCNDHTAIRVSDIERATSFYVDAFGAEILTNPFILEGAFAEAMMGGPVGIRFKMRHLQCTGGVIELFEFLEPVHPTQPQHATVSTILHIGMRVSDVDAVAARVERAGGTLIIPVTQWGEWKLTFCTDLDGNVLEIADGSIQELVRATAESFPEARR